MTILRNLALIALSSAFVVACGSKEKDADVSAPVEDVASEDVEQPDVGSPTPNAEASTAEADSDDPVAARAAARRNKAIEGGGSLRDRRAERMAKRGADSDAIDPKATGPRTIKPGGHFAAPKTRPQPMPAAGADGAVAVATEAAVNAEDGATPAEGKPAEVKTTATAETPVDIAPPVASAAQGVPPALDRVFPMAVVAEILGKSALRERGTLPGIAAVGGYNSVYFDLNSKSYGVALQMWRDATPRETEDRFRRVRLQHPNADDVQALKPLKAFYAGYFGIQSITFARPDQQLVVTLSCGQELCDHAALLKLALAAQGRL